MIIISVALSDSLYTKNLANFHKLLEDSRKCYKVPEISKNIQSIPENSLKFQEVQESSRRMQKAILIPLATIMYIPFYKYSVVRDLFKNKSRIKPVFIIFEQKFIDI